MTRLVTLNLMDNEITDLPLSIGLCIGLGKLGAGIALARNPIISQEMFAKYKIGVDHLLQWLERRLQLEGPVVLANLTLPADLWPPGEKRGSGSSGGLLASPGQIRAAKAPVSPNTARALASSKPISQQDIDSQLGTKIVVLKNWGITTLRTEVRPKLGKMKLGINRPGLALPDVMAIAHAAKALKLEADKCVPFVDPRDPPKFLPSPADKQAALKLVVSNTLDAFIMDGLQKVLQTTVHVSDVLTTIQFVKTIKPLVAEAPPQN